VLPHAGQIVIDAATDPQQADAFFTETARLLKQHADSTDPVGLQRARNQITVRTLRTLEQPARRLESAAQDVFTFGKLRDAQVWLERLQAVSADEVREVFAQMLASRGAVGLAGSVTARARERAEALVGAG